MWDRLANDVREKQKTTQNWSDHRIKNLDLNQNNISLSCCWKRAQHVFVKKGLEIKLGLCDFELNINFNYCFVLVWRSVISSTSKPKIHKCMGQDVMPLHTFFLIYCTIWIQILLTSYFRHIFDSPGNEQNIYTGYPLYATDYIKHFMNINNSI